MGEALPPRPLADDDPEAAWSSGTAGYALWPVVLAIVFLWHVVALPLVRVAMGETLVAYAAFPAYVGLIGLATGVVSGSRGVWRGWRLALILLSAALTAALLGEVLAHWSSVKFLTVAWPAAPVLARALLSRAGAWGLGYFAAMLAGVWLGRRRQGWARVAAVGCLLAVTTVALLGWRTQAAIAAANAHMARGRSLRNQGRHGQAAREFEQAVGRRPGMLAGHWALAMVLDEKLHDADGAARAYRRIVELDGDLSSGSVKTAYRWLGKWYAANGRYEEAVEAYRLYARHPLPWWGRGSRSGSPRHAHDSADALFLVARGMAFSGQGDEAVGAALTAALEYDPTHVEARAWLGLATARLGQWEEGLSLCCEATRANPRSQDAHYCCGEVLMLMGKPEEAAEELRTAADLGNCSIDLTIRVRLADALHECGRCPEAQGWYRRADCEGKYGPAMHGLAVCLREQGRLPETVEVYEDLVALLPHWQQAKDELLATREELASRQ